MTIDEKIAMYKEKAHIANEAALKYNKEVNDAYEEMNSLIQEKYIPLVGKAFKGKDYTYDTFGRIHKPAAPFFVYSLPPITWNRTGMSFNAYQLPILTIAEDNEPGGVRAPIIEIDTLYTNVFEKEDVYAAFTELYEEISIDEFQNYIKNCIGGFIWEVKDNAEHFEPTGDDEK